MAQQESNRASQEADARPWRQLEIPSAVTKIPGMLSHEEIRYYIWLTATKYEGHGAIVDLGCWLGQSAASLAAGLELAGKQGRIISYDRFVWEPSYMAKYSDVVLASGSDFMPVFRENVAQYEDRIEVYKEDLSEFRWTGGPIEFLVVDAAKSWALTNSILSGFESGLIPGKTRVIYQDFRNSTAYWLPLIMDSRPDIWEQVEATHAADTVTFRVKRSLTAEGGISFDYANESFSWQEAKSLFEKRIEGEPLPVRARMRRSLFRKLALDAPEEEVVAYRQQLMADPQEPLTAADLDRLGEVEPILLEAAWDALKQGDLQKAEASAGRCLQRFPKSEQALEVLARVAIKGADFDLARKHARRLQALDTANLRATLLLVEADLQEGVLDSAARRLETVLDQFAGELQHKVDWAVTTFARLAWSFFWRQKPEDARHWLSQAKTIDASNLSVLQLDAVMALDVGDLKAASATLQSGLAIDPLDNALRVLEAQLHLLEGESQAEERMVAVLVETPDLSSWLVDHGVRILVSHWESKNDYRSAEQILESLQARWPETVEAPIHLARLHLYRGNRAEAYSAYVEAKQRNPRHSWVTELSKTLEA